MSMDLDELITMLGQLRDDGGKLIAYEPEEPSETADGAKAAFRVVVEISETDATVANLIRGFDSLGFDHA